MANENNRIALEEDAKRIGDELDELSFTPIKNRACTKKRAELAGCSTQNSYQQNQLVKKLDLFRERDYLINWYNNNFYLEVTSDHPYQVLNMYMCLGTSIETAFVLTPMRREDPHVEENPHVVGQIYTFPLNFNHILGSETVGPQAEWFLPVKDKPSKLNISTSNLSLVAISTDSHDLKNRYMTSAEKQFSFSYVDIYNHYHENVRVIKYDNIKPGSTITLNRVTDYLFKWNNNNFYLEMTADHPYQVLNMYMCLGTDTDTGTENFVLTPMRRENPHVDGSIYTFDLNFNHLLGSETVGPQAEWFLPVKDNTSEINIYTSSLFLVAISPNSRDLKNRYMTSEEKQFSFNYVDIYNHYHENVRVIKYDNLKPGTTIRINREI